MEKIRAVFPNAMHVNRKFDGGIGSSTTEETTKPMKEMTDRELFQAFYYEVKGFDANQGTEDVFIDMLDGLLKIEQEAPGRSEEHTSELQSRGHLVCRLLLETQER